MSRYTPTTLAWGNTTAFVNEINANFDELVAILDDLVSRSGSDGEPNTIEANVDFNSNDINNVGTLRCDVLLIDNAQIPSLEDIQEAFAAFEVDIADAVAQAEVALEDDIAAADAVFQSYLTTASGYVDDAEAARDASQTAQGLAEDAQAGAELAEDNAEAWAAGVNLPAVTVGDAGKRLQVNSAEDGYELVPYEQAPIDAAYVDVGAHQVWAIQPYINAYGYSAAVPSGTAATIGPTGSAADYTDSEFNAIPSYAKGIILGYYATGTATASGTAVIQLGFAQQGQTVATLDIARNTATNVGDIVSNAGMYGVVPLPNPGEKIFNSFHDSVNVSGLVIQIRVLGYTY